MGLTVFKLVHINKLPSSFSQGNSVFMTYFSVSSVIFDLIKFLTNAIINNLIMKLIFFKTISNDAGECDVKNVTSAASHPRFHSQISL